MSLFSVSVVAASLLGGANPSETNVLFPPATPTVGTANTMTEAHSVPETPHLSPTNTTEVRHTAAPCPSVARCSTTMSCGNGTSVGCATSGATRCCVVPKGGVCGHHGNGYMSVSAWEQCCDECYCEEDNCWQRHIMKYCVGPGDMYPHYPYPPAYHGYYYFRPYNWTHIDEAVNFAATTGGDVRAPFGTDHIRRALASVPGLPTLDKRPRAFGEKLPALESLLEDAKTERAPAPNSLPPMPPLTPGR